MKIYMLEPCFDEYQGLTPINDSFWEHESVLFNGTEQLYTNWDDLELEILDGDELLPKGDLPDFSVPYISLFSSHARETLVDLVSECGEFLSAKCDGDMYYLFNVTKLINKVDEDKSEFDRLVSSGRIIKVRKILFHKESSLPPIFKLSIMPLGNIFVTQEFKDKVEDEKLKGFKFVPC